MSLTGRMTAITTSSGPMAPTTANSPSPTSAPAPTPCTRLPTACSANTPRPTSPWKRARTSTWANSTGSPCATASRSGKSAIPNRNGSEFFKGDDYWLWGWCLRYAAAVPQRHHLHHRQERLAQGLVLRGGAARDESTAWLNPARQGPRQPALWLGE